MNIKKILLTVFSLLFLSPAFAADKLKVMALSDFSTMNPSETFQVKVVEDGEMNNTKMLKGDVINCVLKKVTDPTRAKRDAKIYLYVHSWVDSLGVHKVNENLVAKYADKVLNKDSVKDIPSKENAKKAAGFVGSKIIPGFSYGLSFADGFSQNKEKNRFKSGAKQVYEDSFLSYVEYGKEIEIKEGDVFYLVIKAPREKIFVNDFDED